MEPEVNQSFVMLNTEMYEDINTHLSTANALAHVAMLNEHISELPDDVILQYLFTLYTNIDKALAILKSASLVN